MNIIHTQFKFKKKHGVMSRKYGKHISLEYQRYNGCLKFPLQKRETKFTFIIIIIQS